MGLRSGRPRTWNRAYGIRHRTSDTTQRLEGRLVCVICENGQVVLRIPRRVTPTNQPTKGHLWFQMTTWTMADSLGPGIQVRDGPYSTQCSQVVSHLGTNGA